jgi:hypothetical protein
LFGARNRGWEKTVAFSGLAFERCTENYNGELPVPRVFARTNEAEQGVQPEKPSVKDAGWNAAGILTVVSATTTTKHVRKPVQSERRSSTAEETTCVAARHA